MIKNKKKYKKINFLDLKIQQQKIKRKLNQRINKVLKHSNFIMGNEVSELEERLRNFTNSKYCITVGSGTEALMISLMSLNLKRNDEIITTAFSWISTAEVIVLLGLKPIFVDIDPQTCNINTNLIESKITKKTRVIMPVSIFGQPSEMSKINKIAKKNNLTVIEDAAQSFGSTYKKKYSCNLSDIGCTSFFPTKPLGCYGDGGAIFTNNSRIAQICKEIRIHGKNINNKYNRIGINGRMDTLQCAIVLSKLDIFKKEIKLRNKVGIRYDKMFDKINVKRVQQCAETFCVFAQYSIFNNKRDELRQRLSNLGIPTQVYYPKPLNEHNIFKKYNRLKSNTPVSNKISNTILSLPMSPYLKKDFQEYIVESVEKVMNN